MSIKRNTTYNLFGSLIPLAVSLFTTPLYLGLIGESRYGVLTIAWLLLGYFGLFDLGLGRATAQRIAVLQDSSVNERAKTFWTAFILNVGLGICGGLLIWPIATYFFANVFKIEEALRPEIQHAVPWLILAVPMATLSGVLSGALQGRERFLELNMISIFGTILFQIAPLVAARFLGADLGVLLPIALGARLCTLLILFWRCWQQIFRGYPPTFVRTQAGQLLRFGGWITVTSFVGPMMVIFDRFIISAISGAKAVTFYTIPFQLSERSTIIPNALASALFPRFAAANFKEQQQIANDGLHALVVVMTPLIVIGILLVEPFLAWWITPAFALQSALVGQVVLLGFWFNSFAYIPYAQLQARGRPDLVAKCHLGEVLPYFYLLYLGLNNLGLVGAAMAFSLRAIIDFVLLAGFADILRSSISMLLVPLLLLIIAFWIATQNPPRQDAWVVLVIIHLFIVLMWAWLRAPPSFTKFKVARKK